MDTDVKQGLIGKHNQFHREVKELLDRHGYDVSKMLSAEILIEFEAFPVVKITRLHDEKSIRKQGKCHAENHSQ